MTIKTLIFGAIGTLVETSDIQRQAFNKAFKEQGLNWNWSPELYKKLLNVNGGKNRLRFYAEQTETLLLNEDISMIHEAKTDYYETYVTKHGLSARPGINELIKSAKNANVKIGMASTTSVQNIDAIFANSKDLKKSDFDFILSGDDVEQGKPAPDIYHLAIQKSNSTLSDIVVIEDTPVSAKSAIEAGLNTLILPGEYITSQTMPSASTVLKKDDLTLTRLNSFIKQASKVVEAA